MKYTITYQYDTGPGRTYNFWAYTYIGDVKLMACSDSFEEAKESLIKEITKVVNAPEVPAPEIIKL